VNRPIFIFGSHKSGTSLLRSLLDGSDELFVVPIEAHFFQYSGFWVDYALRQTLPRQYTFDEWLENLVQYIKHTNQKTLEKSRTSDNVLANVWNEAVFSAELNERAKIPFQQGDFRAMFDIYVEAIHVSLFGIPPSARRFVEKSVENAEFAPLLKRLYPDAYFVHLVRNPYATLVAIRKHITRQRYPVLRNALAALRNSYYYLYQNPLAVENYRVIRYEDLVLHPHQTMQDLADFLDIKFTPALVKPTVLGKPWGGNSTSQKNFNGISTKPLSYWKDEIYPLETQLITRLFHHVIRDYGYTPFSSSGSVYLPMPKENWKVFLANRWLWLQSKSADPVLM